MSLGVGYFLHTSPEVGDVPDAGSPSATTVAPQVSSPPALTVTFPPSAPPAALAGKVTDRTGNPIPGAVVTVGAFFEGNPAYQQGRFAGTHRTVHTETDDQGRFPVPAHLFTQERDGRRPLWLLFHVTVEEKLWGGRVVSVLEANLAAWGNEDPWVIEVVVEGRGR